MVLARELIVLAQRIAFPVVRAEDPAEVRMAGEIDPDQVVRLALVPIRRRPKIGDARDARLITRREHLDREAVAMIEAPQVVHARQFVIGDVIDARVTREPVELELRVAEDERGDLAPVLRVHVNARMLIVRERGGDLRSEPLLQPLHDLL